MVLAKLVLHVNETTAVAVMNFQNVLLSSVLTIRQNVGMAVNAGVLCGPTC